MSKRGASRSSASRAAGPDGSGRSRAIEARRYWWHWATNATTWIDAGIRLLRSDHRADVQLGFVAAYVALNYCHHIAYGVGSVPGDAAARASLPIDSKALNHLRDVLRGHRNQILHLSDDLEVGHGISLSWKRDELRQDVELTLSVMQHDGPRPITRGEVEAALAALREWAVVYHLIANEEAGSD